MSSLTRNEKSQVAVAEDSSNTDQTRTSTRHNTHVLPCVLALPPLAVVLVIQLCDRLPQRSNTGCWAIFSAMGTDVHLLWPLKASFYAIVDLRCTLSKVCPFFGVLEETVLVRLLACPHNTGGSARSVETGVGLVTFVRLAKLPVNA